MEYDITTFDHEQGTFSVLYSDGSYINIPVPRKDGAYCSGETLENYIQQRHPSIWIDHAEDLIPLLEEDKPNTDLPNEIIQKAALYQPQLL